MTTLAESQVQTKPTHRRFNVDEYYAMAEAEIIGRDERVELIDGEIIAMSPIGPEHGASVDIGNYFLVSLLGRRAIVRVQGNIRLDEYNEPQPDFTMLRWRDDFYRNELPGPTDVLLLVEVSDSSLSHDRNTKLSLYASFGIPEVWIANIPARVVETYADPVDGGYTASRVYSPGEIVSPAAFDDVAIPVSLFIGAMLDEREDNLSASG